MAGNGISLYASTYGSYIANRPQSSVESFAGDIEPTPMCIMSPDSSKDLALYKPFTYLLTVLVTQSVDQSDQATCRTAMLKLESNVQNVQGLGEAPA